MANPNQIIGIITATVDGVVLNNAEGGKINFGGKKRSAVDGDQGAHFSEARVHPTAEIPVYYTAATSLEEMNGWDAVTLVVTCDTGQTYIMSNAWLEEVPDVSGGDGKMTLIFHANAAEESLGA